MRIQHSPARQSALAVLLTAVIAPVLAATAWAQSPTTGFQDGFFIQDANADYRLLFSGTVNVDGRFSLDDPPTVTNAFVLRRLRPIISGRLTPLFEFRIMPDFGNGTAIMQDAWVEARFARALRLRVGKDKTPVGYEMLILAPRLTFAERSLPSNLVPNRDVGIQVLGDVLGTRISYAAAVVNGIPDGSNLVTDTDSNGAKDLAGRVVIRPFQPSQSGPTALSALGFHLGGSTGKQRGALPVFRTTTLQQFFSYAADATADGSRTRVTPGVFYYYKAFGAFSEYARSSQVVARNGIHVPVTNHAWGVTASYFLTGESSGTGIIRPRTDFNPSSGHWGAVQVGTRVSRLTVDRQVFDEGLASSTAASEATSFSVVTSWYPTSYVKYLAMFEVTTFADGYAPRPTEHAIIFRAQVAF